MNSLRSL